MALACVAQMLTIWPILPTCNIKSWQHFFKQWDVFKPTLHEIVLNQVNGLVCKELGLVGDNVLVALSSNYFYINFV